MLRRRCVLRRVAGQAGRIARQRLERPVDQAPSPSGEITPCSSSKARPLARTRARNSGGTSDKSVITRSFRSRWRSSGASRSSSAAVQSRSSGIVVRVRHGRRQVGDHMVVRTCPGALSFSATSRRGNARRRRRIPHRQALRLLGLPDSRQVRQLIVSIGNRTVGSRVRRLVTVR